MRAKALQTVCFTSLVSGGGVRVGILPIGHYERCIVEEAVDNWSKSDFPLIHVLINFNSN